MALEQLKHTWEVVNENMASVEKDIPPNARSHAESASAPPADTSDSKLFRETGPGGSCLIHAVNNALGKHVVEVSEVNEAFDKIPKWMQGRRWDGYRFDLYRKFIRDKYGITLEKVKYMSTRESYIVNYKVSNYYHSITLKNGKVIDNREDHEIKRLPHRSRILDIYKVSM